MAVCKITDNGSGIAEGRDLEAKCFNLAQMPNRSTNDYLTENALLLAIPCACCTTQIYKKLV